MADSLAGRPVVVKKVVGLQSNAELLIGVAQIENPEIGDLDRVQVVVHAQ